MSIQFSRNDSTFTDVSNSAPLNRQAARSLNLPAVPTPLDPSQLTPSQLVDYHRDSKTGLIDTRELVAFVNQIPGLDEAAKSAMFSSIEKEIAASGNNPMDIARFWMDAASLAGRIVTVEPSTPQAANDTSNCADTPDNHQTLGQSLVTLRDSMIRDGYHKGAESNAKKFSATIENQIARNEDVSDIEKTSKQAFDARQSLRTDTQKSLTPGGRAMSQAIETPYTFDDRYTHYENKLINANGSTTPQEVYKEVAKASGRSNADMDKLAKAGKALGIAGTVYGVYVAGDAIANAPEGEKAKVFAQQAGGFVGGAGGAILGGAVGTAAVLFLVSNPVGWAVVAAGCAGSVILGYLGSEAGEKLGEAIYDHNNQ